MRNAKKGFTQHHFRELKKYAGFISSKSGAGFTIIELFVVSAVFITVAAAFFGTAIISIRTSSKASDKIQAAFLLEEGVEGFRYLRDITWKKYINKEQLGYEQCFYLDNSITDLSHPFFATSTPEIVSQWHLDEPPNSPSPITIKDTSTNGNNGTFIFNDLPSSGGMTGGGKYYNAAVFSLNGGDYITFPNSLISGLTNVSIEAWFKIALGDQNGVIIGYQNMPYGGIPTVNMPILYIGTDYKLHGALNAVISGPNVPITGPTVNDNKWHHVVLAVNTDTAPDTQSLYLDGALVGTLSYDIGDDSGKATNQIGTGYATGFPFVLAGWFDFKGVIDDVTIYNRVLSAQEVRDRYNGHAICPGNILGQDYRYIDNKFKRTVELENVCRNTVTKNIVPGVFDSGFGCSSGTSDSNTKRVLMRVIWGPQGEYVEQLEAMVSNIFAGN